QEVVKVPGHLSCGKYSPENLEARLRESLQLAGQKSLLDFPREGELLLQPFFAEPLGVQRRQLQYEGHLQANRRQKVQVLDAERQPAPKTIHLDDAEPLAVLADERHAQQRA